jgi:hypothetical protein
MVDRRRTGHPKATNKTREAVQHETSIRPASAAILRYAAYRTRPIISATAPLSLVGNTGNDGRDGSSEQDPINAVTLNQVGDEGEQEQGAYDVEKQDGTGC